MGRDWDTAGWVPGTIEEVEYPGLVRKLLGEEGIEVSDGELDAFLEAEHAAWQPARMLASTTHALLEALRDRGLKVGLVSNALDPPHLLHHDLEEMGIAQRLCPDAVVLPGRGRLYARAAAAAQRILRDFSPVVERASIDEAYIDDLLAGVR